MIGSKNQLAMTLRDIAAPITTPPIIEMKKPTSARYIVRPVLMNNSPESASLQMRSTTLVSEGSTNGVNMPLRANASQPISSANTEDTRAMLQSTVCTSDGVGAASAASFGATASVRAIAASGS